MRSEEEIKQMVNAIYAIQSERHASLVSILAEGANKVLALVEAYELGYLDALRWVLEYDELTEKVEELNK